MYSHKKMKRKNSHKRRSKKQRSSTYRNKKQRGGNTFFAPTYNLTQVHPYNAYDLNTYSNIPTSESARNLPALTGGKRNSKYRFKKYNKKSRKIRGGLAPLAPDSLNAAHHNSGWNSSGSSIINSSSHYMPINVPYGNHNPALI